MEEQVIDEDIELTTIFDLLCSMPEELFSPSIPFWQRKAWSRSESAFEEYEQLNIYSEQLVQRVSSASLLFTYNYFNFKKEMLSATYKRSILTAFVNVSLLLLGIVMLFSVDGSLLISIRILTFLLITLFVAVPYIIFVMWRNSQEFQFYDRVEKLLGIAQKRIVK